MTDHGSIVERPRLPTRPSSSLPNVWLPQSFSLCVVRVSSQPPSTSRSHDGENAAQCSSVEFCIPPLDSEASKLSEQQLIRCGHVLASPSESSVASTDGGLCFGLEDEVAEAAESTVDDQEDEELFSRAMQAADADTKGGALFFCVPMREDLKHRVLGIAAEDIRAAKSTKKRFLMLLLTPNKTQNFEGFGGLRAQLRAVAAKFFAEEKEDGDFEAIEQLYKTLQTQQEMESGLLPNGAMARRLGGGDVVATLHALLLQGRVVCYSASASAASAAVMALLALLPSQLAHSLLQERDEVFTVQPCCDLKSGEKILKCSGGFLLGTNNPLLLRTEDAQLDLVLDLDAGEVTAHPTATSERAFAFGTKTAALADGLTRRFTDPVAPMHMPIAGQRRRDNEWVLAQCRSYFEELLDAEVAANLHTECENESDRLTEENSALGDLFPASLRSMLEEIAAPVLGSLVYMDDDEPANPRSAFCADYGWSWTLSWQSTNNYANWIDQELRQRRLTRNNSGDTSPTRRPPPNEGHAAFTYPNGDEYDGDFYEGKREGYGVYIERSTGNQYDGAWLNDERHGRGMLTSRASGGYIYDGEWVHDMRCGQGHSTRRGGGGTGGGESYTGQWRANRFHGRGVYVNSEGDVYDGEWCDGVRHGAGKLTVASPEMTRHGDVVQYVGEWMEGKLHGIGSCKYKDGSEYSGAFNQGKRHGNGIHVMVSGDRYEGQWWQGLRHGQGVSFSKSSGTTREGTWKRGVEVSDGEWLITFANGDKYSGSCRRGRPWGKGTCKFANGAAYTGEWVDGLREGRGVCITPDGTILEGEWQHSVFVKAVRSPSRFVDVSLSSNTPPSSPKRSSVYSGEEMQHPMTGTHRYVYPNRDVYEGEFKEGHRNGFGIFTERATGNTYEGQWMQDLRHGSGVLTSGSRDFIYDGAWENDERCGYGHCVISGGRETYSGQWRGNSFHGTGNYTDAEGNIYEGEFVQGKKHGVGKLIAPASELQSDSTVPQQTQQYTGEWRDGCREGLGDAVFSDGSRYSGQWKDDLQTGEGTFTSTEGDRYVGQWRRGCREGAGVLTIGSSGVAKEGQWCRDEPVDGEWTIVFPDGSKFTGECVGGRPHGRGICKYAGGDLYDGMWVHGKRHGSGSGFFANGESFVGQWENNHVALNGQGKLTLADGTVHVYDN
ncbi:MORN repeat domain-containing protein [Phytophthora infestans]|uniref:MORN repeat domain-containing protein n=1 Tax=Phytophthora infestans TaxID=4787 RepID=A0A8S9V6U4_PHYIN|nr:MORN repeat domain-containing protein [Phytophthora infestans]